MCNVIIPNYFANSKYYDSTALFHRNFVHDPKMANEPTVSASVKLQYIGRNGDRYVVSRCMEAKQMAKNVTGTIFDTGL